MSSPVSHPDFAFMRARLSHWIALGLGCGLSRTGPGTVGSLGAWAVWVVLLGHLQPMVQGAVIVAGFAIGLWACERCAQDMGVDDHGAIVWDEIIAFWFVLWLAPAGFASQFIAFVLFRFFDIVKPPPIGWLDRNLRGGLGIMIDDVAAAFMTVFILSIWQALQ
jgi:phosphatidylglycerophosphatase A